MNSSTRSASRACTLLLLTLLTLLAVAPLSFAQTGYTGIFGGGPFYKNSANITEIENSGFTEAIVWSVEVKPNGDLNLNGEFPLTSNGVYIGDQTYPDFAASMSQLKQGTVKRVTFSIGSSNFGDWQDIAALVRSQGTGTDSILYKDFAALKAAIPALDALDFDDENSFDAPTTIQFAVMLGHLGYHVIPDAFSNASYWTNLVSQINTQLPGTVDGVHLQAYAGGAGNNPCSGWNFGNVPVWPGLWDRDDTPAQVQAKMSGWNSQCGINGGFMWLYDDFVGNGLAAQYAAAINNGVNGGSGGFTLSGPSTVFLNEDGTSPAIITITPQNGFHGKVTLSLSQLPRGVEARIAVQDNQRKITFRASANASTGFFPITVTGKSGDITQTLTMSLAISAALGSTGSGTPVDLSSAFNLIGIFTDGIGYTTGGLDGVGYSYSANLLGTSRVLSGTLFDLGTANLADAVGGSGQTISLPQGQYSALMLLATGVQGNQTSQGLMVNYSDGSSTHFVQSFSDWFTPQKYARELEGVAMAYRNYQDGTKDKRTFNLYAYRFNLDGTKGVESITLPNNAHVVVLAATLVQ
ncbi:MAG TPA: hypothetical protein VH437_17105 [Terriglobales bacterium]